MKINTAAVIMTAMLGTGWGGEKIQVHVNGGNISSKVLLPAEDTASRMFAKAGVRIAWRYGTHISRETIGEQSAIVVEFSEDTSPNDHPGALAYARPYEGVHIVVLYDRMQKVPGRLQPVLLAHVLVHELTHLFQAVPHHSATGIMKARWDTNDYNQMLRAPLAFAPEDVEMIERGMLARKARATFASPAL